jgi:hypothetical protein
MMIMKTNLIAGCLDWKSSITVSRKATLKRFRLEQPIPKL